MSAARPLTTAPRARVRSFTRRGGRMPAAHQSAYDELAGRYLLAVPQHGPGGTTTVDPAYRLAPEEVFGRRAPLVVEVGAGSGEALVHAGRWRPDWDFLAFEVWRPGVGHALARLRAAASQGHRLDNVRLVEADAAQALPTLLPAASTHEVWTFFPDPWPKKKHHKRRLVDPQFAATVADLLERGGVWRLATDWADYADHVRAVLGSDDSFELLGTDRAPLRPATRFERRGLAEARAITDLAYRRV